MGAKLEHKFLPLPRQTAASDAGGQDKYEVVIVGAGPAGAFLNLLLARFGVNSRPCIDSAPGPAGVGHADGLFPRTLEVLKSLDLADDLVNHGKQNYLVKPWVQSPEHGLSRVPRDVTPPRELWATSRYEFFFLAQHKGWVVNAMEQDLAKYSPGNGVQYETALTHVSVNSETDPDYPVLATISTGDEHCRTIRAKYLVAADGAHSAVRRALGIKMLGESVDDVYCVIDIVPSTNFPDIRKVSSIVNDTGAMLMIPRERTNSGDWLLRFYVPFLNSVPTSESAEMTNGAAGGEKKTLAAMKESMTPEKLISEIAERLKPYRFEKKEGTDIEWFTMYQVGQRLAERISEKDQNGKNRVFLIGDACHTHSPKQGQGMNVSMADGLDLAWKLAHVLLGLSTDPDALLSTFINDRYQNASLLVDADREWYAKRYGEEMLKRLGLKLLPERIGVEINNFILGLNIEHQDRYLVDERSVGIVKSENYSAGALREGRRVADRVVERYADSNPVHVQDVLAINGKYYVLLFAASSFRDSKGPSWTAAEKLAAEITPRYPKGSTQLVVIFPESELLDVDWSIFPGAVLESAEMHVLKAHADIYALYGVDPGEGAIVVVQPDQHVGTIATLADLEKVRAYLDRVLVRV